MKILITTQSVDLDNPVLAFFHTWLKEFAKKCEEVTVICLEKGRYDLPSNVRVLSLGKENNKKSVFSKLQYIWKFYKIIFREKKSYKAVFVHMNPEYVVIGGWFWKLSGKKIALWYTHRQVDLKLRLAEKFADIIFTASAESFRLPSKKVRIVGHGIDVDRFSHEVRKKTLNGIFKIIHVGRITAIKNCDTLVEAARILKKDWNRKFEVVFIGDPTSGEDQKYFESLKNMVELFDLKEQVRFIGKIANENIPLQYAQADISVNLTPTGGLDKAVLESMASGLPVLSSNREFIDYFGTHWTNLIFEERNAEDLAGKIMKLSPIDLDNISRDLKKIAVEKVDVSVLIPKMLNFLEKSL